MKTKTSSKAIRNKGKSISVNDCKTYSINFTYEPEPIIDLDELECICAQMAAIQNGYGHDFGTVFYQEVAVWEWRDNGNPITSST